ncbi:MAG: stage II sporulation protein M [Paenibacillaceae bacterium]
MSDLSHAMQRYMKEHMPLYVYVAVLFITGVIFGIFIVQALTLEQKQELSRHLGNFFQTVDLGMEWDKQHSFWHSLMLHIKWLALICVLGISVVGLPFILFMDFLKGILIGFSVGFMVGEYAWKGMLFALVSVVPQNLLVIPSLLICSVTSIAFGLHLLKTRFLNQQMRLPVSFQRFIVTALSLLLILLIVSLYEALLSPLIMQWVTPILINK